ncbi:MAG: RnfABCDGE type electron transport complex subunit B [Oscillospiraceae bacterium]|nr:RnfABCDGE type electron transport complex subunit B [Oscillospiraceae bacterium]
MYDILIAFIIVTAIGVIAGIVLVLASHFFNVPQDETEMKVRECLPSVNCGACGYAGCDDYAKAVAEGKAATNLCIPGSVDTAKAISDIMGVEAEAPKDLVAFVKCNGNKEAAVKKADYQGVYTCKAASMVYAGPNECKYGCIGCGDCANVCPTNAISIKDGIAVVDTRICIGCGLCTRTCPKLIIKLLPQDAKVAVMCSSKDKGAVARKACKNACIACKKCELNCPDKAITVEDNLASIDYSKCVGCGVCAEVCPTGCIKKIDLYTSCILE